MVKSELHLQKWRQESGLTPKCHVQRTVGFQTAPVSQTVVLQTPEDKPRGNATRVPPHQCDGYGGHLLPADPTWPCDVAARLPRAGQQQCAAPGEVLERRWRSDSDDSLAPRCTMIWVTSLSLHLTCLPLQAVLCHCRKIVCSSLYDVLESVCYRYTQAVLSCTARCSKTVICLYTKTLCSSLTLTHISQVIATLKKICPSQHVAPNHGTFYLVTS